MIGVIKDPKFSEFVLFLKFAEVYGSGYLDDVDYTNFNKRNNMSHRQQIIRDLEKIVQIYDLSIVALNMQKKQNLIG